MGWRFNILQGDKKGLGLCFECKQLRPGAEEEARWGHSGGTGTLGTC